MHVDKYTIGATGNLFKHFAREKNSKGEYVSYGNQNIDRARSHLNYNLAPAGNQHARLNQRLSEVRCMKRGNVNVCASVVITLPKELHACSPEEQRRFFEAAYRYFCKEFGEENAISAYVHNDEKTPHLHFVFVPVVKDKKRGDYKVSAKERITRSFLQSFHSKAEKAISMDLGYEVKLQEGDGVKRDLTMTEYKLKKAKEDLEQTKESAQDLTEAIPAMTQQLDTLKKQHRQEEDAHKERLAKAEELYHDLDMFMDVLKEKGEQKNEMDRLERENAKLKRWMNTLLNAHPELKKELEREARKDAEREKPQQAESRDQRRLGINK